MISLEDKIFDFSETLVGISDFNKDCTSQLIIDENFIIRANHVEIENNQWVYNVVLYNKDEIIDSIYCDRVQEELEDIIIFLIEEYIEI